MAGALAGLALLASCAPDAKTPVQVVVLVYDYHGHYVPQTVELTTVTDLVAMQGSVARILGGASFDLSPTAMANVPVDATEQQILAAATKGEGSPVHVSYLEKDGALVPADFHSLNIVTTYYNFERAFQFFQRVGGLSAESFGARSVYYFPTFIEVTSPENDNAAFVPLLQGFVVLPFDQLQQVPLGINAGVIGHEFTHSVFNYRVFSKAALPFPYSEWGQSSSGAPGLNLLRSIDEGLADTFGTGITCSTDLSTCDATFFGESLPIALADQRRLDAVHCMTSALRTELASADATTFSTPGYQYLVGSVLSGALWRAANDSQVTTKLTTGGARLALFRTLFKALAGGADGNSGIRELIQNAAADETLFHLETSGGVQGVLDAIAASATDATLKATLCSAFLDRFQLTASDIPTCAGKTAFAQCQGTP